MTITLMQKALAAVCGRAGGPPELPHVDSVKLTRQRSKSKDPITRVWDAMSLSRRRPAPIGEFSHVDSPGGHLGRASPKERKFGHVDSLAVHKIREGSPKDSKFAHVDSMAVHKAREPSGRKFAHVDSMAVHKARELESSPKERKFAHVDSVAVHKARETSPKERKFAHVDSMAVHKARETSPTGRKFAHVDSMAVHKARGSSVNEVDSAAVCRAYGSVPKEGLLAHVDSMAVHKARESSTPKSRYEFARVDSEEEEERNSSPREFRFVHVESKPVFDEVPQEFAIRALATGDSMEKL
eukprot:TRINITY_DN1727_c0_g1_i1.p1 TRINITY_DN1727_c0_g1~~TRINITY_DN1727_c0_g1_i1.p1  ORF type:complete len:298 (-),score=47.50 TRINITY_DN1727_c0_g1_i1:38-931(-)